MTAQQIANCIGLTFDIVGVIMLFFIGLPSDLDKHGAIYSTVNINDTYANKWKKVNKLSKTGLSLIIFGFALQLLSTCWTIFVPVPK